LVAEEAGISLQWWLDAELAGLPRSINAVGLKPALRVGVMDG